MKFASTSLNSLIVLSSPRSLHSRDQVNCKNYHNSTVVRNESLSLSLSLSLFPAGASPFRDYLPQRSIKFSNSCCWANPASFLDLISPSPATRARTDIFLACRSTWNSQAAVTRCVSAPSARSNSAGNFTENWKAVFLTRTRVMKQDWNKRKFRNHTTTIFLQWNRTVLI